MTLNPNEGTWVVADATFDAHLDFDWMTEVAPALQYGLKGTLCSLLPTHALRTVDNYFTRTKVFLVWCQKQGRSPLKMVTVSHLTSYRSAIGGSTREWWMAAVSIVLRRWKSLGYEGVSDDVVAYLDQISVKGTVKGEAVLTQDPISGPFSDIELESTIAGLDGAFEDAKLKLRSYVLCLLEILLGSRMVQFAALKACDIRLTSSGDYLLSVPRAKQNNEDMRLEFKERMLVPEVGILVLQLAQESRQALSSLCNSDQAPLFPSLGRSGQPPGYEFHSSASGLAKEFIATMASLGIPSERTGEAMRMTATRFRRTLGTRAAAEGHGELVIAELLDHSDTQSVKVYVQATPAIVKRIDKAIAMRMAPMAQAFTGVLIDGEDQATRKGDPASLIVDPRIDASPAIGNCGKHGFCGYLAPIACYTCKLFQPWVDGPHERVLEDLLAERERLVKSSDLRIASINDRTILAVAEVVQLCSERRAEKKK